MKLTSIGDLHSKPKAPFYEALKNFFKWIINNDFHIYEYILIFLGDIFHETLNTGKTNKLIVEFFNSLKNKIIYILQGNHDFSRKSGSALDVLKGLDKNIKIIDKPCIENIEGLKVLFLPYYYPHTNDLPPMEEYYSNLPDEIKNEHFDFIFHHIQDKTIQFNKNKPGIDISYLKTDNLIGGHIHTYKYTFKDNKFSGYLGGPVISRFDEKGKNGYLYSYDLNFKKAEIIKVPKFLDYYSVDYPNKLPEIEEGVLPIWDINEAPSKSEALELYGDINYREIFTTKVNMGSVKSAKGSGRKSIKEYFEDFTKLVDLDDELKLKLINLLRI